MTRPAGELSAWLAELEAARRGESGMDVPCDGCTACCRSRQFIHIEPDEADTLAQIPRRLVAPAPGLSRGHVVLGYDQHGRCPMLVDDRCSIYEHRPRACRVYDCRVFAAAGIDPDDDKPDVRRRVREWEFSHSTAESTAAHAAVNAAAAYLVGWPDALPGQAVNNTQVALAAIAVRDLFDGGRSPQIEEIRVRLGSPRR